MKLDLKSFPLGLQIPQTRYCIFYEPVNCTNLITCSAKLSLNAAKSGKMRFVIMKLGLCLQFNSILYFSEVS